MATFNPCSRENVLAVSTQGTLLRCRRDGLDLVVKAAMGRGPVRALRERTLLREYQAYRRLVGIAGVPRCHGLVGGRYLVLDLIDGTPYRDAVWADRGRWFVELLALLRVIHARADTLRLMVTFFAATCIWISRMNLEPSISSQDVRVLVRMSAGNA